MILWLPFPSLSGQTWSWPFILTLFSTAQLGQVSGVSKLLLCSCPVKSPLGFKLLLAKVFSKSNLWFSWTYAHFFLASQLPCSVSAEQTQLGHHRVSEDLRRPGQDWSIMVLLAKLQGHPMGGGESCQPSGSDPVTLGSPRSQRREINFTGTDCLTYSTTYFRKRWWSPLSGFTVLPLIMKGEANSEKYATVSKVTWQEPQPWSSSGDH